EGTRGSWGECGDEMRFPLCRATVFEKAEGSGPRGLPSSFILHPSSFVGWPEPYGPVRPPGPWLLEPDPAVIRAGLGGNLARRLGAWPIDARLAYLSADRPVVTPFARTYRVGPPEPFSAKGLARRLRELGAGDVVLKTRGAAVTPEILRQPL